MSLNKTTRYCYATLTALLLAGCATHKPVNPQDPYESFNRGVFAFNMQVDKYVYTPVATVYTTLTPSFVQAGVDNALDNIGEISVVANDILQGQLVWAMADTWRFIINSTFGIGGLFDVAKHVGLPKNYQDLGLTLAKWGIRNTPYLMIPFLGPSTVSDAVALPVDYYAFTIYPHIYPVGTRYGALGVYFVNMRVNDLPEHKLITQAFDPYVFVRDAYFQFRKNQLKKTLGKKNKTSTDEDTFVPESKSTS